MARCQLWGHLLSGRVQGINSCYWVIGLLLQGDADWPLFDPSASELPLHESTEEDDDMKPSIQLYAHKCPWCMPIVLRLWHMLLGVTLDRKQASATIWVWSCQLTDEFDVLDGKTSLVRNAATDDRLICRVLSVDSDTYWGTSGDSFLRPEGSYNINEGHPKIISK